MGGTGRLTGESSAKRAAESPRSTPAGPVLDLDLKLAALRLAEHLEIRRSYGLHRQRSSSSRTRQTPAMRCIVEASKQSVEEILQVQHAKLGRVDESQDDLSCCALTSSKGTASTSSPGRSSTRWLCLAPAANRHGDLKIGSAQIPHRVQLRNQLLERQVLVRRGPQRRPPARPTRPRSSDRPQISGAPAC